MPWLPQVTMPGGSRSFPARQRVHIGGGQGVAANSPGPAFHLLDHAPGDAAHVLAFDRDHHTWEVADDLALLFLAEDVLDNANLNEGHPNSPAMSGVAVRCRGEIERFSVFPLDRRGTVPNRCRYSKRQFHPQSA